MEDKQLSPDQSLELIQQMIRQTRRRLITPQGNLFLWWGFLCTLSGILIYVLLKTTGCNAVQWLWLLPGMAGIALYNRQYKRKMQAAVSYTDNLLYKIWNCILALMTASCILLAINEWPITGFFPITLLLCAGLYISGSIIGNKYMQNASACLLPICFGLISQSEFNTDPSRDQLLFALIMAIGLIGSGYSLNKQIKGDAQQESQNQ